MPQPGGARGNARAVFISMKRRDSQIFDTLDRLAQAEREFLRAEFLAPVLRGRGVSVRIAGVRCTLRVEPAEFAGWGVFRPLSHTKARCVAKASMAQRRRYLDLLPAVQLVTCQTHGEELLAVPANPTDGRFAIEGLVRVMLAEEVDLFDRIIARFDGAGFWFDEADARSDPAVAAYLRRSLIEMLAPERLEHSGIEPGHRAAYAGQYNARMEARLADERCRGELRLRNALRQAGASLSDFAAIGDAYRVTYEVDGRRHISFVRSRDLTIQSAGICLSGQDQNFDLNSLVGVMREAVGQRMIPRGRHRRL